MVASTDSMFDNAFFRKDTHAGGRTLARDMSGSGQAPAADRVATCNTIDPDLEADRPSSARAVSLQQQQEQQWRHREDMSAGERSGRSRDDDARRVRRVHPYYCTMCIPFKQQQQHQQCTPLAVMYAPLYSKKKKKKLPVHENTFGAVQLAGRLKTAEADTATFSYTYNAATCHTCTRLPSRHSQSRLPVALSPAACPPQGATASALSEESSSLSPASRVLALADQVADEDEQMESGVDSEGQHLCCCRYRSRDGFHTSHVACHTLSHVTGARGVSRICC